MEWWYKRDGDESLKLVINNILWMYIIYRLQKVDRFILLEYSNVMHDLCISVVLEVGRDLFSIISVSSQSFRFFFFDLDSKSITDFACYRYLDPKDKAWEIQIPSKVIIKSF